MRPYQLTERAEFKGAFSVVHDPAVGQPDPDIERYVVNAVQEAMDELSMSGEAADVTQHLAPVRDQFAADMRQVVEDFISMKLRTDEASGYVRKLHGAFIDRRNILREKPFLITPVLDDKSRSKDLQITVNRYEARTAGADALIVRIGKAITIVLTALNPDGEDEERRRVARSLRNLWGLLDDPQAEAQRRERVRDKRHNYLEALSGYAEIGLRDGQVEFANLLLDGFEADFVAREAGVVKNRYLNRLGGVVLVVMAICAIGYLVALDPSGASVSHKATILFKYKEFWLLGAGAAAGCWLSFVSRRVTLGFADLAILEEDRLNPRNRVIAVVLMTLVVGLLLKTGAVQIAVGDFKTELLRTLERSGSIALLVGLLCGIAERAVSTAVASKAAEFAGSIGGGARRPAS